jgi:hypothetical protein
VEACEKDNHNDRPLRRAAVRDYEQSKRAEAQDSGCRVAEGHSGNGPNNQCGAKEGKASPVCLAPVAEQPMLKPHNADPTVAQRRPTIGCKHQRQARVLKHTLSHTPAKGKRQQARPSARKRPCMKKLLDACVGDRRT